MPLRMPDYVAAAKKLGWTKWSCRFGFARRFGAKRFVGYRVGLLAAAVGVGPATNATDFFGRRHEVVYDGSRKKEGKLRLRRRPALGLRFGGGGFASGESSKSTSSAASFTFSDAAFPFSFGSLVNR